MSELYSLIESLCKKHGTNITAMCKSAGVSRAPLTELKMGRTKTLSSSTLSKIASYFGVSVDYLLGSAQKEDPQADQIDLSDVELGFLGDYKELTEENKATVRDMVRLMRERQKEG